MKLNTVDLNKLRTFLAVARAGGVSAAAGRLALTRSAVSQSVTALERSLGVALFHRVGRRLVPTRQGRLLQERFAEHEEALARTLAEITAGPEAISGLVRIGVYLGFPRPLLARLLERLARRHATARWQVLFGSQDEIRERLTSGRLDVAFSLRSTQSARQEIRSTSLFAQELVLAGRRPWASPGFTTRDLERVPVIDYYRSDPLIERWIDHHHRGPRRPKAQVIVWAATTDLALELVLAGVGVGVLPRPLIVTHLRQRRLATISPAASELVDQVWLDELRGPVESPVARAIRDAVAAPERNMPRQREPKSA